MRASLSCLLVSALSCLAGAGAQDTAADRPAELRVLDKYIGTWDVVAGSPEDPAAQGTYTAKWVLDGRFVHTTGTLETADGSNDFKLISLMTYDPNAKKYRVWNFMSNGLTSEAEATWDANTQTMTRVTRYGEVTQTAESDFSQDGVEKWTMVAADSDQNVVSEMKGTNKRRKE